METAAVLKECDQRMDKSVEYLRKELHGIRTGRANTGLVEYVKVDYYGSPTDLRDLAAISVAEATQLVIKPFDPGSKNDIIKAVETAELGLNPMSEGDAIRINIPAPSADRRKQLVMQVKKLGEESKVAIRNERRDANKKVDQLKSGTISEDDAKSTKEDIDELTKKHTNQVDTITNGKVQEIEEV
ncbi:MAG: ribosome recycling factor [Phycisphaerae bacterium]|nr:ribosome recycling factor [Phycisphaerae bacterium]